MASNCSVFVRSFGLARLKGFELVGDYEFKCGIRLLARKTMACACSFDHHHEFAPFKRWLHLTSSTKRTNFTSLGRQNINPVSVKHSKAICKAAKSIASAQRNQRFRRSYRSRNDGLQDGTSKIFQVFEKLCKHQSLSLPPCHPQMNACPLRNCNGAVKTRSFCAGGAAAIFQSHQWLPVDSRHACPVKSCIFSFTSFTQLFGLPAIEYFPRFHAVGCVRGFLGAIQGVGGFVLGCTVITVHLDLRFLVLRSHHGLQAHFSAYTTLADALLCKKHRRS